MENAFLIVFTLLVANPVGALIFLAIIVAARNNKSGEVRKD